MSRVNVLLLTLAVSVGINVLQARYIGKLLNATEQAAVSGDLEVGAKVPPLQVSDLSGAPITLSYGDVGKPTVLYIFRPSCVWCRGNAGRVAQLTDALSGRYRIVGISLTKEGLPGFVASHHMTFPVYSGPARSVIKALHLGATPQTIVISPAGVVLGSWDGAYVGGAKAAVERFFGVALREPSLDAG
jgi:peroxiredoxin